MSTITTITDINNIININNNNKIQLKLKSCDLFLKIFRSLILRNEIFKHVRLYNKHEIYSIKSLNEFTDNPNKEYISELIFINGFNKEINSNNNNIKFTNLKIINFGNSFNMDIIEFGKLLPNIEIINFGNSFNREIYENYFNGCNSLNTIIFGDSFNCKLLVNSLPNTGYLKQLILGNSYNHPINENILPNSIEKLIIGNSFKFQIGNNVLPLSLIELSFGQNWDLPLSETYFLSNERISNTLKKLTFLNFNHPIYNELENKSYLPKRLEQLIFISKFNQKLVKGSIGENVKKLEMGFHFSQIIDSNVLPIGLISFHTGQSNYYHLDKLNQLPNTLESIKIPPCSFQNIKFPINLKSVSIGYYFKNIHLLPKSVTELELDKLILSSDIPLSITSIKFSKLFNNNLNSTTPCQLPSTITSLDTGDSFNQPLRHSVSNSIISLRLGDSFNFPIEKNGPLQNSNIIHLTFSSPHFQYPLNSCNLPSNLKSLTLSKYYNKNSLLKNISNSIKISFV